MEEYNKYSLKNVKGFIFLTIFTHPKKTYLWLEVVQYNSIQIYMPRFSYWQGSFSTSSNILFNTHIL